MCVSQAVRFSVIKNELFFYFLLVTLMSFCYLPNNKPSSSVLILS